MVRIEVRSNNTQINERCAICNIPTEAQIPFWFFLYGTHNTVCEDCAEKYNSGAVETLDAIHWWVEAQLEAAR